MVKVISDSKMYSFLKDRQKGKKKKKVGKEGREGGWEGKENIFKCSKCLGKRSHGQLCSDSRVLERPSPRHSSDDKRPSEPFISRVWLHSGDSEVLL